LIILIILGEEYKFHYIYWYKYSNRAPSNSVYFQVRYFNSGPSKNVSFFPPLCFAALKILRSVDLFKLVFSTYINVFTWPQK
jgi:hypothetical protein